MYDFPSGIKGFVLNLDNERISNAQIRIQDRDKVTKTTQYGEYWRLLLPGYYHIEVMFVPYINILLSA